MKYLKFIKKSILVILVTCMTVGLISAKHPVFAAQTSIDKDTASTPNAVLLNEDDDLRDESSKSFIMSDKSIQKIIYSMPIHYYDDKQWKEIDNTFIDDGLTESSDEVVGYQTKSSSLKMKFSKKIHKSQLGSIQSGIYKLTWGLLDYKNDSQGKILKQKESKNKIEKALDKVNQEIIYNDVWDHIDINYNIDSLGVKENIIIEDRQELNEFAFEYKSNHLILTLEEDGKITAKDNKTEQVIFILPKPFMYDSSGSYSKDVCYELLEENNKYIIKIVADKEWMNDESRVYPLTLDPVIKTETTKSAIDTTFVTSGLPTTNHYDKLELLVGKESSEYANCRTLVKFILPKLNRGDMIVDAALNMASYKNGFYASTTPDLQVNAHMATAGWAINTVTWNTCPTYESSVLDYDYIKRSDTANSANWKTFDITNAVKKWYDGTTNNGIVLKSYNESGTYAATGVKGYFWPERYNSTTKSYPYISLTYRNNKGLEDYWDFSSISTTSAGDVSINNYSGNIVVLHGDASTTGNKLPVGISHIYNGYMSDRNVTNIKPLVGKGWKLNIQQTLRPSSEYGLTGTSATTYPYVYMDEDGTEHYFKKVDTQYLDEDGLGLELKVISDGYTITDSSDTVMTFGSNGCITKITDSNKNQITYTYSGNSISSITDGNNQTIQLTYDGNGYLTKITDYAKRETTFTYTNQLLTQITYPDGKTSIYAYDGDNALSKMTSSDGTSLQFSYSSLASGKRISKIVEKGSGDLLGQTVKFDRSEYNITEIITSGIDYKIDTADDIKTMLQFDNAGRLTSRFAYTDEKGLGAESAKYTSSQPNSTNSDIKKLNRITNLATISDLSNNKLVNHSGESTTSWISAQSVGPATFTFTSTSEEKLFGQKSFKLDTTSCSPIGRARFCQDLNTTFIKPNTTYTASAYIKTKNVTRVSGNNGGGAGLIVFISAPSMPDNVDPEAADFASEYIVGTTDTAVNNGWRRVSVTFTTPSDVKLVRVNGVVRGATGTAYFDGIQIEKGNTASPYNLVENCSFERATSSFPDSWSKTNLTSSDVISTGAYMDDAQSIKITPSATTRKEVSQIVNITGKEEDTYVVSGWAYGKGVKETNEERKYKISIRIGFTDGTYVWKTPAVFNSTIKGWKYSTISFDLSDETDEVKTPASIKLCLRAWGQANTIFFDSIQLTKQNVTYNIYDNNGNIIESDGVKNTYEDNKLTSTTDEDGNTTTIKYDENGNPISETSDSGIKDETVYDQYGNIIQENVKGSDGTLQTKTEEVYDPTGAYKIKSIDEDGYTTLFDYNINKGLLNSVTDANNNKTSYTYDENDRLKSITSNGITNILNYDSKGRTTGLSHIGASYSFTYDGFNNKIKTLVGNTTLVTDTYANGNGDLIKRTLGNGHYLEYQYDEFGNLIVLKENGTKIEEDYYDALGNMFTSFDYKTNVKLKFDYDLDGKVIRIDAFDMKADRMSDSRLYGIEYGYDSSGNLIKEIVNDGSQRNITEYKYGKENHVDEYKIDSSKKINYTYDSLDRTTSKTLNTTRSINTSYDYYASNRGSGYTTSKVQKETIDGIEYVYTYDKIGNITSITSNNQKIDYIYDANSQLIRENNQQLNKTIVYTYDNGGNIQSKKEYAYTTGEVTAPTKTINYTYSNDNWKDQLTSYNGQAVTYDSIGNPITYKGYTMTWNGRELLSMNKGSDTISYRYGSDGMRRSKTVNNVTTTYDYVGDKLIHEKRNDCDLYYTYDNNDNLVKITLVKNNVSTDYYVTTNMRGDVEALYNAAGTLQARYIYDSWGKTVSVVDANNNPITSSTHIGNINSIRYRGYYLDIETGLYYLQSRYYDAEVMRFINADDMESMHGNDGMYAFNVYCYCANSPVNMVDADGKAWINIICAGIGIFAGYHFGNYIATRLGYTKGWKYNLIRAGIMVGGAVLGWFAGTRITKLVATYLKTNTSVMFKLVNKWGASKFVYAMKFLGVNPYSLVNNSSKFIALARKLNGRGITYELTWAKSFYNAAKKYGYKVYLDGPQNGYTYHLHLIGANGKLKNLHFQLSKNAFKYFKNKLW